MLPSPPTGPPKIAGTSLRPTPQTPRQRRECLTFLISTTTNPQPPLSNQGWMGFNLSYLIAGLFIHSLIPTWPVLFNLIQTPQHLVWHFWYPPTPSEIGTYRSWKLPHLPVLLPSGSRFPCPLKVKMSLLKYPRSIRFPEFGDRTQKKNPTMAGGGLLGSAKNKYIKDLVLPQKMIKKWHLYILYYFNLFYWLVINPQVCCDPRCWDHFVLPKMLIPTWLI